MTRKKLCCVIPVGPNHANNASLFASIENDSSHESEFIIVLDGTPVSISRELQEFSSQHSNVKLVYSNARNPGGSRNLGMIEAKSEFIVFFDADDSFNTVEILKGLEEATDQPEAIIFDFTIDGRRIGDSTIHKSETKNPSIQMLSNSLTSFPGIWRWVFRAESLIESKFLEFKMGEDIVFLINFLNLERRIEFSTRVVYNYNLNLPAQLTKSKTAKQDLLIAFKTAVAVISNSETNIENRTIIGLASLLLYSGIRHLGFINRLRLFYFLLMNCIKSLSSFKLMIRLITERPQVKYGKK
jgi:glycosyltransferase involved in cell wall biosynthesis